MAAGAAASTHKPTSDRATLALSNTGQRLVCWSCACGCRPSFLTAASGCMPILAHTIFAPVVPAQYLQLLPTCRQVHSMRAAALEDDGWYLRVARDAVSAACASGASAAVRQFTASRCQVRRSCQQLMQLLCNVLRWARSSRSGAAPDNHVACFPRAGSHVWPPVRLLLCSAYGCCLLLALTCYAG